jgi:hypothetical protein
MGRHQVNTATQPISNSTTGDNAMAIQELCKEYEVPSHMMWLLYTTATDYSQTKNGLITSLQSLKRDAGICLAEAAEQNAFWRDCRHIASDAQRMAQDAAGLEQIVDQTVTLIHLCAQEITFNTVVNGEERSDQFKVAARSIIFGVQA